jgi:hypothetical protein
VTATGKLICRSEMSHAKDKKNGEVFYANGFIAAVTQFLPPRAQLKGACEGKSPGGAGAWHRHPPVRALMNAQHHRRVGDMKR